jgi:hypothetical protein
MSALDPKPDPHPPPNNGRAAAPARRGRGPRIEHLGWRLNFQLISQVDKRKPRKRRQRRPPRLAPSLIVVGRRTAPGARRCASSTPQDIQT